jgi:Ca-activated chloride channel family protein
VTVIGNLSKGKYEAEETEQINSVRQFARQNGVMYRRKNTWVTPETEKLDIEKDKEKIEVVERFSEEYFELIRKNTAAQNEVFARQAAEEQLLVKLRGQVYLVR